jgi:hypothetical protein
MPRLYFTTHRLAFLILVLALGAAADAQTRQRTFVSNSGSDANDCSELAPCRNWQAALDKTISGGEVVALTSGGFGTISITKSVTITGEGVHAVARGTNFGNGSAITVDAPGATVILRHLYMHNNTTGQFGIAAQNFSVLHIEHCTVNGFYVGISFEPSTADGTPARKLFINDSISRNNQFGIFISNFGATGTLVVTIDQTKLENNLMGGFWIVGARATISRSVASGNGDFGFKGQFPGTELNIEECVLSNNTNGIVSASDATVRVSNSVVTNNTGAGFLHSGGTFESRGNNTLRGNSPDISGTITPITGQ